MDNTHQRKREALAWIAGVEGYLVLSGKEMPAGEAIERYLSMFRDVSDRSGNGKKDDEGIIDNIRG